MNYGSSEDDFASFVEEKTDKAPDRITWCRQFGSGDFRGFCFVEFFDDAAAIDAMSVLNGLEFDGRMLKVERAMARPSRR